MKAISLFSGCGGMDLGAEQAGVRIVFANELDADASETLRQYFQDTEICQDDIANVKFFPKADLVIGGYPCQPFSMGGNRDPEKDGRSYLYVEFARVLNLVQPKFFIAENVSGLRSVKDGQFLKLQLDKFGDVGQHGYYITYQLLNANSYGIPQVRKRVFIVGVRKDLGLRYTFPPPTHGKPTKSNPHLKPYTSHGNVIAGLPLWPKGEFYERPHDPEGHWSWYYMSRNRKKKWDEPSYTIVANWRHIALHPASPVMKLTWSNLADGWKQRWDFSDEYEHLAVDPTRPILEEPRRLSWRECALIQGFPPDFTPFGETESKFQQIGNAVPVELARIVVQWLVSGKGLKPIKCQSDTIMVEQLSIF